MTELRLTLLADELDRVARAFRDALDETGDAAPTRPAARAPALYAVGGRNDLARRALAMELYRERRERDQLFAGAGLAMAEPAWDMLLLLYALQTSGQQVAIMDICTAGRVSQTTGLRHLGLLIQHGLVTRSPDLHDGRRALVAFSPEGLTLIETFLNGVARRPTDDDRGKDGAPFGGLRVARVP